VHVTELLHFVFRWAHLIAGIMWIGNSMLFNWLDRNLIAPPADDAHRLSQGKIYMVHSGAFYEVEKKLLEPKQLPDQLHWFKWQNGITWMTGISLMVLVFYMTARSSMIDPQVMALEPWQAIAISVGSLVIGWTLYDLAWRLFGKTSEGAVHLFSLVLLLGAAFGFTQVLSGGAAYIQTGVLMGTIMTGNVWMVILPSQRELIASTKEGREQDKSLSIRAKQRSIHNNYLTFPLLFIMMSGHFAGVLTGHLNWAILFAILIGGAAVRHFMNVRYAGKAWLAPALGFGGATLAAVMILSRLQMPEVVQHEGTVGLARVQEIVALRCKQCHGATSTDPLAGIARAKLATDEPSALQAAAKMIRYRVYEIENMPLNNVTAITKEERAELAKWIDDGAKLE